MVNCEFQVFGDIKKEDIIFEIKTTVVIHTKIFFTLQSVKVQILQIHIKSTTSILLTLFKLSPLSILHYSIYQFSFMMINWVQLDLHLNSSPSKIFFMGENVYVKNSDKFTPVLNYIIKGIVE